MSPASLGGLTGRDPAEKIDPARGSEVKWMRPLRRPQLSLAPLPTVLVPRRPIGETTLASASTGNSAWGDLGGVLDVVGHHGDVILFCACHPEIMIMLSCKVRGGKALRRSLDRERVTLNLSPFPCWESGLLVMPTARLKLKWEGIAILAVDADSEWTT